MRRVAVTILISGWVVLSTVAAQETPREHQRLALRLRSASANELANTLNNLLRAEGQAGPVAVVRGVVLVPHPTGNSLLVGGPPDAVAEVCKLVEELDQTAATVLVEVVIAEAPADEMQPASVKTLARVRLVTTDNKSASLTFGRKEPRITGVKATPAGQVMDVTHVMTGTILGITPRILPDETVVFELAITDSRLGLPPEDLVDSDPNDSILLPAPIESLVTSTTLCLRDGETAVLSGQSPGFKPGTQLLILVTPHFFHSFTNR